LNFYLRIIANFVTSKTFKMGKRLLLVYDLGSSKLVCDLVSTLTAQNPESLSPGTVIFGRSFLE